MKEKKNFKDHLDLLNYYKNLKIIEVYDLIKRYEQFLDSATKLPIYSSVFFTQNVTTRDNNKYSIKGNENVIFDSLLECCVYNRFKELIEAENRYLESKK